MQRRILELLAVVSTLSACDRESEPEPPLDPPELANTVALAGASGVHLGDGLLLTNWHVCTNNFAAVHYNRSLGEGVTYVEGEPLDPCLDPAHGCTPSDSLMYVLFDDDPDRHRYRQDPFLRYLPVFAQRAIDLCILEPVAGAQPRPIPEGESLAIDPSPVQVGQEVVVGGHPLGSRARVVERCRVIAPTILVRDPDQVSPSDLEVESFKIDCKKMQHGASGSPVFDAQTGMLLGLLWTGECVHPGRCMGPSYVSAASAWQSRQGERPVEHYSRLRALLEARVAR